MKKTSFKMELRSPEGGALTHLPFFATLTQPNRKKENKNDFDKRGHFSHRNFISRF